MIALEGAWRFVPLMLVSAATIAFEVALTRYFAVASWSEYGYWVISIAMVGLSASGVVLMICGSFFVRHSKRLLFLAPVLLIVLGCLGFHFATLNPFNPLELQNRELWLDQVLNIGKYYAALFPFFFVAGCFIGLSFLVFQNEIPKVYAADLIGAGIGAVAVLALMLATPPFFLLAGILPLLALAGLFQQMGANSRLRRVVPVLLALAAGEVYITRYNHAEFNQYKPIFTALHVPGARVVDEVRSPRGHVLVLENFTERLNTDLSNNMGILGAASPPSTYGAYRDGSPVAELPKAERYDGSYLKAALDAFPYLLMTQPRVLLIGTRGGYRIREALDLGAAQVTALEPDATIFRLVSRGEGQSVLGALGDPRVSLRQDSPIVLTSQPDERFDLVDIASDFLAQNDNNKYAFATEAIMAYYEILTQDGVISLPVSIKELTVYGLKMAETARRALLALGVRDPVSHIAVYRSAWNARILVSKVPLGPATVQRLKQFCDERSFDLSFFPGIDPAALQVWNDLPLVSFEDVAEVNTGDGASDALAEELIKLMSPTGEEFRTRHFFDLTPATYDRPFFHAVLRPERTVQTLERIELIPREEIGYLVNFAVMIQALVFALAVLALPLFGRRDKARTSVSLVKGIAYFSALGVGFLFIEILFIEKASFYLNDRTSAFALVLAGMLVFSGAGSYSSYRWMTRAARGVRLACVLVVVWTALLLIYMDSLMFATIGAPFALKCALVLAVIAPVSFFLGAPFPLGLSFFRGKASRFVPWAWGLNGAFSVLSTPLANLLSLKFGYTILSVLAIMLYFVVLVTVPAVPSDD